ncbi:MAG: hypothetical protein ABIJ91_00235 [Candidatus Kuenenbacteria bacterium]
MVIIQNVSISRRLASLTKFTPHQKNAFDHHTKVFGVVVDEVGGTNELVAVGGLMSPTSDTFGAGFTLSF